jgi:LPXTG-motif cell wall-anchored protein
MSDLTGLAASLAMLAGFALLAGAAYLRRRDRRRALLMLAAGVVILFNVIMFTMNPPMAAPQ